MPCPLLCGDPATQPLLPCLGLGSIQGPDRYCASRGRASALHGYVCVWCEVRQQFLYPLTDRLGERGGSAEKSARRGYYTVLVDAPQTKRAQSLDSLLCSKFTKLSGYHFCNCVLFYRFVPFLLNNFNCI